MVIEHPSYANRGRRKQPVTTPCEPQLTGKAVKRAKEVATCLSGSCLD
jgi:hypothetical protein